MIFHYIKEIKQMSVSVKKQDLKNSILNTIKNNKENYTIVILYRELLAFNSKIRIYLATDIYDSYINELYNIMDTYLYGSEDINLNESIEKIYTIINDM